MEKRYQVFLSSTYADLKDERQKVIQTLMELDCIPSGMELFPAIDEEQWLFIKRIIDDCDYYIIIVGGRYGSLADDRISYTEKEYDYAIEKKIKVIALIHGAPDTIAVGKTDKDPMLSRKLEAFIERLKKGRLVKFWTNSNELPGLVALSIAKTIKTYPATGWVRSNSIGSTELLNEINDLRKENEKLHTIIDLEHDNLEMVSIEIADFNDIFVIKGRKKIHRDSTWKEIENSLSWKDIFVLIAPYLLENPFDSKVNTILKKNIFDSVEHNCHQLEINDQYFQTIKIQLSAYGLVNIKYMKTISGSMALFWSLTKLGNKKMIELRTIKKN